MNLLPKYRPSLVIIFYIAVLIFTASVSVITLFAAPPTTTYGPGETLTPSCAPGDTNCTVAVPWTTSGTNVYSNLAGNVGIGTSTPYAALSVVGEVVGSYFTSTSTTATSTFAHAVRSTCFSVDGTTCLTSGSGGLTSLNGLTGGTQTFANSNDTNVTISIGSSGSTHTFTTGWSGTLAVARGGLGQSFASSNGWLNVSGGTFSASTSPTVNWITATSTTATSTLPHLQSSSLAIGTGSSPPNLAVYVDGTDAIANAANSLYVNAAGGQIQMIGETSSQGPSMFLGNGSYGWSLFYQNTASISPDPSLIDGQDGDGANGGDIYVRAGDALSGNKLGGTLHLNAGDGNGTQVGGDIEVFAGTSVNGGTGGNVILRGGQGTLGNGAVVVTSKFGIGTSTPYAPLSVVGQVVGSYFTATTSTASVLPYASSTALTVSGSTYLGSLTGPLQAVNGLVSASSSLSTAYGGLGQSFASSNGWLNVSNGTFSASTSPTVNWLVATSTTVASSIAGTLNVFGSLGVGTTPSYPLDVNGNMRLANGVIYAPEIRSSDDGLAARIVLADEDVMMYQDVTIFGGTPNTFTVYDENGNDRLNVQHSNVGIGTTTPYAPLSVVGQVVGSYFTATTSVASTLPYASSTAQTISGTLYVGSLNGPLQANAGLVSATTSIGVLYGGTGLTTAPSYGNLLVGNASGGYTLTATSSLKIALSDTVGILSAAKGGTGLDLSASNGWLNVSGGTFSASTSPTVNWITATSTTATSTFPKLAFTSYLGTPFSANAVPFVTTGGILNQSINFTFDGSVLAAPTLSTDSLNLSQGESINLVDDSSYSLSATSDIGSYGPAFLTGTGALLKLPYNTTDDGLLVATDHGSLFELASDGSLAYLAGSTGIGTTSPSAKLSVKGAGTGTGRALAISSSDDLEKVTILDNGSVGLSTTSPSALFSINNSGTVRAIAISRSGVENFSVKTDGTLTLASSYNGPLQANAGLVSATTSIGVLYGGTGLTTAPSYGNLLVGNASGGYTLTATSSLKIALSDTVGILSAAKGGTGLDLSADNGWLNVGAGVLSASTSPTINWFVATSTTATSTIAGGLNVRGFMGVGTSTPDSKARLHVYNGQLVVGDPNTVAGDYFAAGTGNTRVRINSSGEISADKYYDSANSSYYIDPRSGTNLAVSLAVTAAAAGDQLFNLVGHASQSGDYINVQKTGTTAGSLLTMESNGNIGIGTSTPYAPLSVLGQVVASNFTATTTATSSFAGRFVLSGLAAAISGDSALCLSGASEVRVNTSAVTCTVSSRRFKHDIQDLGASLPEIMALQPRTFQYNGSTEPRVGLIAEEVLTVDPRLVFYEADGAPVRGVRYEDLVPLLAKGIQEQQGQIDHLAQLLANGGPASLTVPAGALSELVHTGSLIVDGVATFATRIDVGDDIAGRVIIPAGQTMVRVTFAQPYTHQPVVNLTLRSASRLGWYRVTGEDLNGFQIEIAEAQSQPVEFNWLALGGINVPSAVAAPAAPSPVPAPVAPEPVASSEPTIVSSEPEVPAAITPVVESVPTASEINLEPVTLPTSNDEIKADS